MGLRGQLVEHGVDVHAALRRQRRFLAAEVVAEPLHHGAGRDLPALDGVLAGHHGVGVGAEDAFGVKLRGALAEQQVRRASDEGQLARRHHIQPDHCHERVGAAFGDRDAGRQTQLGGDIGAQPARHLAHIQDARRETIDQVVQSHLGVEVR
jgi:hypothetical protein